jgi:hypothetical protein
MLISGGLESPTSRGDYFCRSVRLLAPQDIDFKSKKSALKDLP